MQKLTKRSRLVSGGEVVIEEIVRRDGALEDRSAAAATQREEIYLCDESSSVLCISSALEEAVPVLCHCQLEITMMD
jgi:hypothetical protein